MKRFLSTVLFTMILASPTLADPTTTTGGGPNLPTKVATAPEHLGIRHSILRTAMAW